MGEEDPVAVKDPTLLFTVYVTFLPPVSPGVKGTETDVAEFTVTVPIVAGCGIVVANIEEDAEDDPPSPIELVAVPVNV